MLSSLREGGARVELTHCLSHQKQTGGGRCEGGSFFGGYAAEKAAHFSPSVARRNGRSWGDRGGGIEIFSMSL